MPNKDQRFNLRVTARELTSIKYRAKKAKMSAAAFVISAALDKEIIIIDGLAPLIIQLKSIGNNLNQLTTLANMGKISAVNLESAAVEFEKLCDEVAKLSAGKS